MNMQALSEQTLNAQRDKSIFSLDYLPLLIRLKCIDPVKLPRYLGSTLRGVTGWALLAYPDAYQYLFENRKQGGGMDIVNPYIIDPPEYCELYHEGDELRYQIILVGEGARYARQLIYALAASKQLQLGAGRKRFELVEVRHSYSLLPVWQNGRMNANALHTVKLSDSIQEGCGHCSVNLITPLRIRRKGETLRDVDFQTLIRNITGRLTALTERYGGAVNADEVERVCTLSAQIKRTSAGLYVSEVERYSSKRKIKMDLSGLLGAMTFEGDLSMYTPWLKAARILHVGRNTTFGCGRMDIVFC